MAQVTSPIILDSTGQQIHSDLQQIKNVLTTPSAAEDITFDNTGTGMQADDVQDAITELKSNLTDLQKTTFGTKIDLTAGTDYTTQYDGYFMINFNGGDVSGNNYVYGTVNGVRLLSLNSPKTVATFGYENDSVFVRKGSVLQFTGSTIARGSFIPIVS